MFFLISYFYVKTKFLNIEPKQRIPGWYLVLLNTVARRGIELSSEKVGIITAQTRVKIISKQGRRAQILEPTIGWVSMTSSQGKKILQYIAPVTFLSFYYFQYCA